MYKYNLTSKKIRYVLESDVRVLSILSMSKRVLLHMHEPVDEDVPDPILPHMRVLLLNLRDERSLRGVQKGQLGVPVHGLEHRAESVLRYPSGLHTGPDSTC